MRGVEFREVWREFRRADWALLLAVSIPAHLLAVYLRALRWKHLLVGMGELPTLPVFRAVAVGFMANNVFPLRMGEFIRCWLLARERGLSAAAILSTVVIERVLDTLCVIGLALGVIAFFGGEEVATWQRGVLWLSPLVVLPALAIVAVRAAPERSLAVAEWGLRPFPRGPAEWILEQLRSFADGLASLRGGSHLVWVLFHSIGIWVVVSPIPFLAGFWSLGVDFGSTERTLAAGWMTLTAVGVAVALPSAPGFFGLYHTACRLVLERFGLPAETSVAIGTLCHVVFWVTLTALGAWMLRGQRTRLSELERAS